MSNLMQLRAANQFDVEQEQMNNPLYQLVQGLGSGFNQGLMEAMKEKKDEQRRQENVKKQMADQKQQREEFLKQQDNSALGKMVSTLDNEQQQRVRGVIKETPMTFDFEQGFDEKTGMPYTKQVLRSTTPTEQKAIFETQKQKMDMAKQNLVTEGLGAYQSGIITHQQFFNDLVSNGIPIDDSIQEKFKIASEIREDALMRNRIKQGQMQSDIPQGFEATEMQRDMMGNLRPAGIKRVQQPTEMDALNA